MKKQLKISYRNFYQGFDPNRMPQDYFYEFVMSHGYNVVVDDADPDLVFYSVFSQPPSRSDYKSDPLFVATSFEPYPAQGDYDFCFGYGQTNCYRFPLWLLYIIWDKTNLDTTYRLKDDPFVGQGCHHTPGYFVKTDNGFDKNPMFISNILTRHERQTAKSKFCNFTYGNPVESRILAFQFLSKYKSVDSTGSLMNNTGYRMTSKSKELSDYKFTIAFENSYLPGYVTEKLLEPLAAGSLPIYLGHSDCLTDFNPNAFINVAAMETYDDMVNLVKTIDNDDSMYQSYMSQPVFGNNVDEVLDRPRLLFNAIYERLVDKHPRLK